jgi:TetR/AcrR family transcriptional regulator
MEKEEEGKLEAILNAAQRMFGQYGLTKTTMTEIATEVGMGKASLYYYFPTKESLYEAVLVKEQGHFIQEIQKSIKPAASAVSILRLYTKKRMMLFQNCVNLSKVSFENLISAVPCVKRLVVDFGNKEVEVIQTVVELGIENGEFEKIDAKEHAQFLVEIMTGLRIAAKKKRENMVFEKDDYIALAKNMTMAVEMFISSIEAKAEKLTH